MSTRGKPTPRRKTPAAAASGTPPSGSRRTLRSRSRQTVKAPRVVGPPKAGKRSTTNKNPQAETATAAAAAEAAKAGLAPSPEEAAKLQSLIASTGRASITPDPQEEAAGAAKAGPAPSEKEQKEMALRRRRGKLPAALPASVLTQRASVEAVHSGETPGVQPKRRVPSGVGKFKKPVAVADPAAEKAARDAVERWMDTFTPTADAAGILSMRFLENQGKAIVDGTMFIPPPLSVEGLAGEALIRDGSGSLQVQQAILELVGNRRQELVESVAAKLLTLERCAASAYAFQASGIPNTIRKGLTDLLVSGTLPYQLMTYLADFIQTGGTYDILMNPAGWLMSELGSLVTQDAINTYIVIWLTNQLISAQMFAQMAGNEDLNDEINTKSEALFESSKALLENIQDKDFFDQLDKITAHVYRLFQKSAASFVAAVAVGSNVPEITIRQITTAGERLFVNMSEMPQKIVAQAAEAAQAAAAREKDRRSRALQTAQMYGDAAEAARLALRAPVPAAGLSDFGMYLLSRLGKATGQLISSALVLAGMRPPEPTDMITKINKNIADMLIGRYLGYIQQMGYAIVRPSQPEPVLPQVRLTERQSEKIINEIKREEREGTDAAEMIVRLIDRRVTEINPAAAGEPCPRRSSLSKSPAAAAAAPPMDLSDEGEAAGPAAPRSAAGDQMDQSDEEPETDEEEETQRLYPTDESLESATEGSRSGGRKRKRHSTRSSKSSKSSKSGTRKHGKAKSKRVKRDAGKTRHMRLVPGAGHRTRKHKHSKRGRK